MLKESLGIVLGVIALVVLVVLLKFGSLAWNRYFAPQEENIRRSVFEETKSYNHGKIQDLSKYFVEYQEGDSEKKEQIKNIIQMQFSTFKAENIENSKLRSFLIQMRGF